MKINGFKGWSMAIVQATFCSKILSISVSGWWLGHPPEKYERQLG